MQQERINEQTKLDTRRDSLLVWAHDDTTLAGQTYQYRIRLGVFKSHRRTQLGSVTSSSDIRTRLFCEPISEPTQEVTIPKMMHVFPTDVLALDTGGGVKVRLHVIISANGVPMNLKSFPARSLAKKPTIRLFT
jgi:hypothetical protein